MSVHTFFCIDGHTCGNPVRLVAGGGPLLKGATMSERRLDFLADYDWIRTGADVRAARPRRDVGLDPLSADARRLRHRASCSSRSRGCLPMCGHGTIGTVTMAIENGLVTPRDAGRARPRRAGRPGRRRATSSRAASSRACASPTSPSYLARDRRDDRRARHSASSPSTSPMAAISTPSSSRRRTSRGLESMSAGDVLRLSPDRAPAAEREDPAGASRERDASAASATSCGPASRATPRAHARNAVFYGDKAIDRSPCGTGTSARMAQLAGQGQAQGRRRLRAREHHRLAVRRPRRGDGEGRQPRRHRARRSPAGRASTGLNTIFVDDRDPFAKGFQVV